MKIRTRFAPSPTGLMHIGNIRTALLNYIFAKANSGTFVLRIEDTDPKRNFDPGAKHIQNHLNWLGLTAQEGPTVSGPHEPYFQSERNAIYQKHLEYLQENNFVYRCFCTQEELESKRQRQIAMKKPPRYDGTCSLLNQSSIDQKLSENISFVWRMKVDRNKTISFKDLARNSLTFDLKNFSDFPLTREDGSFTFMFANCVDDFEMSITHVLRGEDHLTNTVGQVVLLEAFKKELPTFWHLAILCNKEGKKLSKRDQGFSLEDLKEQGFLPEAICNYLGIIGGSFEKEILSLDELSKAYNFENISSTSQIRYDIEKLRWINHKWIAQYDTKKLVALCKPFLEKKYSLGSVSDETLECLISSVQTDLHTLEETCNEISFYFEKPTITKADLEKTMSKENIVHFLNFVQKDYESWDSFSQAIKSEAKVYNISNKELFSSVRLLLTGSSKGLQIHNLFTCLGKSEFFKRLQAI